MQTDIIKCYTDGSYHPKTGKGAWACAIYTHRFLITSSGVGSAVQTTNQEMELRAMMECLRIVEMLQSPKAITRAITEAQPEYIIYSDSQYVLKGIQEWMKGWKCNGWKTTARSDVKHKALWMRIDETVSHLKGVKFEWVKGHSKNEGNDLVDKLANSLIN